MKNRTKRILAILLAAVMALTPTGCKKKDSSANKGPEISELAETTPIEAVTMEDLFEIQTENKDKYAKLLKAVNGSEDPEIPNSSVLGDIRLRLSIDMMGGGATVTEAVGTVDLKSFDNIAHMLLNMEMKDSANADREENSQHTEMYIDNTGDDGIVRIYQSEEEGIWTLVEKSVSEMIEQYAEDENSGGQDGNPDENKRFKDLDEFLKKHTVMQETEGVFRNTTTFTIPEFRVYYRNDINASVNGLADKVMEMLSGVLAISAAMGGGEVNMKSLTATVTNMLNECINGMTGEVRITQDFDAELKPTVMTFELSKISTSVNSGIRLAIDVEEFSVRLTNRDEPEPFVIPDDVKENAVEEDPEAGASGLGSGLGLPIF